MGSTKGETLSGTVVVESRHIKSRERVRDLGEVYTQPREVNAMLDLIPDAFVDIDTRFLEPAAGDGNFLVAILERKIALIDEESHGGSNNWREFAVLRCLASIYAIDIDDQNVKEARHRLREIALVAVGDGASGDFQRAADEILRTNVVVGDSLNGGDQIVFVEYTPLQGERFQRVPAELEPPEMDLFYEPPPPLPTVHCLELGA